MAKASQRDQSRGQDAPAVQGNSQQMPIDLEHIVRGMMQQMEAFKREPRLQHLFPQEQTPIMAYDVPRPSA